MQLKLKWAIPVACSFAQSGTEPLVRVMVEAETQESADAHAKVIAEVVERELA